MEKRLMMCSDQFWSRKQKSDSHDIRSWLASRNKIGIPSQARHLRLLRGCLLQASSSLTSPRPRPPSGPAAPAVLRTSPAFLTTPAEAPLPLIVTSNISPPPPRRPPGTTWRTTAASSPSWPTFPTPGPWARGWWWPPPPTRTSCRWMWASQLTRTSGEKRKSLATEYHLQSSRSKKSFVSQDKYRTEVGKVRNKNN